MDIADIIVVDNDPDDAELTTYALKESDKSLRIMYFKSGNDVLNYLFQETDHHRNALTDLKLILLDLKIPKMDGLEILKQIRENEQTRTLPVVILTSSRERKDVLKAYANGANSYVIKPVGFELFVKTISALAHYWTELNVSPVQDFRANPNPKAHYYR